MKWVAVAMLAVLLTGCATEAVPIQPVSVRPSDFCEIATKITWDIADTASTITEIRRHNAKYDARCGQNKPPTS